MCRSHPEVPDLHIALNPYQREACGVADDGYLCFDAFDADKVRVLPELRLKMSLLRDEQSVCEFYSKDVAREVRHKFQDHVRALCVFVSQMRADLHVATADSCKCRRTSSVVDRFAA